MRSRHPWFRSAIICLAFLLEGMSSSSINVQVHAISETLGVDRVALGLIAAAFLIAYAGLLPAAGRLVDTWNRRAVFLLGVALFGTGCALCATALAGWQLVLGRAVQGAGAALSAPATLALITADLPAGPTRNRVVTLYGAMGAAGFSVGLAVPGFVVASYGWRASFGILVPVVLAILLVAWRIPSGRAGDVRAVDLPGAAVLTAGLMIGMHAISGLAVTPPWLLAVEVCLVAAAVLALRRRGKAGFPVEVTRAPQVRASCVTLAAVFAGVVASTYVVSLGLQQRPGVDAFDVGLLVLPQPLAFAALSPAGALLVRRFGPRAVSVVGMAVTAVAVGYLGLAGFGQPWVLGMLPGMAGIGAGLALTYPAASIGAVDAAPADARGTTSGLLTTWQNAGGAVGLAVVTALGLVPGPGSSVEPEPGIAASAALVVFGLLISFWLARSAGRGSQVTYPGPRDDDAVPTLFSNPAGGEADDEWTPPSSASG